MKVVLVADGQRYGVTLGDAFPRIGERVRHDGVEYRVEMIVHDLYHGPSEIIVEREILDQG